jgi:hypothetical protein
LLCFSNSSSFHYSTDKAKVYAPKNKISRALALI